mmetsp:Transcript_158033/g.506887  ORF Transcript_158033/g.506887 Transcript_158033/m.506887 type:complete len:310 (-) Transcript_158033:2615-3544(-)
MWQFLPGCVALLAGRGHPRRRRRPDPRNLRARRRGRGCRAHGLGAAARCLRWPGLGEPLGLGQRNLRPGLLQRAPPGPGPGAAGHHPGRARFARGRSDAPWACGRGRGGEVGAMGCGGGHLGAQPAGRRPRRRHRRGLLGARRAPRTRQLGGAVPRRGRGRRRRARAARGGGRRGGRPRRGGGRVANSADTRAGAALGLPQRGSGADGMRTPAIGAPVRQPGRRLFTARQLGARCPDLEPMGIGSAAGEVEEGPPPGRDSGGIGEQPGRVGTLGCLEQPTRLFADGHHAPACARGPSRSCAASVGRDEP